MTEIDFSDQITQIANKVAESSQYPAKIMPDVLAYLSLIRLALEGEQEELSGWGEYLKKAKKLRTKIKRRTKQDPQELLPPGVNL